MPRRPPPSRTARRAAASFALLAACAAERDAPPADAVAGDTAVTSPAVVAVPRAPATGPLTAADLDLYERGLAHEIALVEAAQVRLGSAATPADRGAAQQAQYETSTIPAAAAHLGVDAARYREVRATVHDVLRTLDMAGMIDGPTSIDTARATAAQRARLADPYGALPEEASQALRARLDRLAPLYARYARLVAVAG